MSYFTLKINIIRPKRNALGEGITIGPLQQNMSNRNILKQVKHMGILFQLLLCITLSMVKKLFEITYISKTSKSVFSQTSHSSY